jgi:hypothetical protein
MLLQIEASWSKQARRPYLQRRPPGAAGATYRL